MTRDPAEFTSLLAQLRPQFKRKAHRLLGLANRCVDIDDLMQVATIKAWEAWCKERESSAEGANVLAYMAIRGKGAMYDLLDSTNWAGRGAKSVNAESLGDDGSHEEADHATPENYLHATQMAEQLMRKCRSYKPAQVAVRRPHHQTVLRLLVEGFNGREIAGHLGVSEVTVSLVIKDIRQFAVEGPT
ncbi:sigma factor [Methylibium sp.]|uniref:RNA polymerase sigma factor n=1 Tax=Methylibium sp. TaxID=2067992 RepID=UPI00184E99DE|nr:sigma factor [Methylibium sp.]MBA3588315.1 hypothetical protein [Methylibium sp.]